MISIILLCAWVAVAAAQGTTTVSLFLVYKETAPSPTVKASVVAANPTATTYSIECGHILHGSRCDPSAQFITVGPSNQDYVLSQSDLYVRTTCTFSGSTDGTCTVTESSSGGSPHTIYLSYLPSVPCKTGGGQQQTFPGFNPVLVTAGAEKLLPATTTAPAATEAKPTSACPASLPASSPKNAAKMEHSVSSFYGLMALLGVAAFA